MNNPVISHQKFNILIIDDQPQSVQYLVQILRNQGYRVTLESQGEMGVEIAKASPPDLILLDVNMPGLNGYEVCHRLKASEQTKEIPILFIIALDQVIDKVVTYATGGADYITKPFESLEVLARVEHHLRMRQMHIQLIEQKQLLRQEMEARRQTEVEMRLLLATTQAISYSDNVPSALQAVLRLICMTIKWDYAEAWIPDRERKSLECSLGWYGNDAAFVELRNRNAKLTCPVNIGLQGNIWNSQEPAWVENIDGEEQLFVHQNQLIDVGLRSAFGVPILQARKVLAILIFYKKKLASFNSRTIDLVIAVATQLGSLIQRKQTEEMLRITQERYHSIVENAVEGIYQITPSGHYLSANLALAKIYGYESPEELMMTIRDIEKQLYVNPKRRLEFKKRLEVSQSILGFESKVYRKDGQVIWISENARAVRDLKGKLLYYEGTVSDITDRKLAQEQTEKLLLNILPKPIAERLQKQHQVIADSFADVSVLFADLVGFTKYSSDKTSTEIVELLNQIFSEFDLLCQKHNLEKIKTIGDAYMVVGGLPIHRPNHPEAIAKMALDMQKVLKQFNVKTQENLNIRIGINIGPVVAGVIGLTKFIYDLWGDTVNVASRMESSGIPGEIQVTAAVYERLKHQFVFKKRGTILIKGKGEMITYLLREHRENANSAGNE